MTKPKTSQFKWLIGHQEIMTRSKRMGKGRMRIEEQWEKGERNDKNSFCDQTRPRQNAINRTSKELKNTHGSDVTVRE